MSKTETHTGLSCLLLPQAGISPDTCLGLLPDETSDIDAFVQVMDGDHVCLMQKNGKDIMIEGTFRNKEGFAKAYLDIITPTPKTVDTKILSYLFNSAYPIIVTHTIPEKSYLTFG